MNDAINPVVADPSRLQGQSPTPASQPVTPGNPVLRVTGLFELQADLDDNDQLLRHRFLCRRGSMLLVGNTGIGKSSLTTQMMMLWALGRPCLGIVPARPLKSLMIQGENDAQDLVEMRDGVAGSLRTNESEETMGLDQATREMINANVLVRHEYTEIGEGFCTNVVGPLLQQHRPDLLWIDPVLQYLGGDSNSQEAVGRFLRNDLHPLIQQHNCAVVLVHHTSKPRLGNQQSNNVNLSAYDAAGSAEFSNWPRAVLSLKAGEPGVYRLAAAKRGNRLRWREADGVTAAYERVVRHSVEPGTICWLDGAAVSANQPAANGAAAVELPKIEQDAVRVLAHIPQTGQIEKRQLIDNPVLRGVMGKQRIRTALKRLQGRIKEVKPKRPENPLAVYIERVVVVPADGVPNDVPRPE